MIDHKKMILSVYHNVSTVFNMENVKSVPKNYFFSPLFCINKKSNNRTSQCALLTDQTNGFVTLREVAMHDVPWLQFCRKCPKVKSNHKTTKLIGRRIH